MLCCCNWCSSGVIVMGCVYCLSMLWVSMILLNVLLWIVFIVWWILCCYLLVCSVCVCSSCGVLFFVVGVSVLSDLICVRYVCVSVVGLL